MSLLLPHFRGTSLYKHSRLACLYFSTLIALHLYLWEESQPQGQATKPLPLRFTQRQCLQHTRCCSRFWLLALVGLHISFFLQLFFQWCTWGRTNWCAGGNLWTHWVWQILTIRQVLSKQGPRQCASLRSHSECWQLICSNISRFPGKLIA